MGRKNVVGAPPMHQDRVTHCHFRVERNGKGHAFFRPLGINTLLHDILGQLHRMQLGMPVRQMRRLVATAGVREFDQ